MNDTQTFSHDLNNLDWQDLVGHEDIWVKLHKLVLNQQLPQVLLFDGRAGIGKRKLMAKLVASFFCPKVCGVCSSCRAVVSRTADEVLWIDGDLGQIKIEAAQAIQEHLALRSSSLLRDVDDPSTSARRVVVVSDIENMGVRAANRLLKTIEEPPAGSCIILSTSRFFQVIETIRSRAIKWHIAPPSLSASIPWLETKILATRLQPVSRDRLNDMLQRNGLAPGLVLLHVLKLQQSDWPQDMDRLFDALIFESSFEKIFHVASDLVRQYKMSASDLLDYQEMALHRFYQRAHGLYEEPGGSTTITPHLTIDVVRKKRKILSEARRLAIRGKISLNVQLLAEVLSLP